MNGAAFNPVLVVPVFNHGTEFAKMLPGLQRSGLPIIVVDDGSSTETRQLLESLDRIHDDLDLMQSEKNEGKGSAVDKGLRRAIELGYSHAVQIDADGQHDPDDIARFLCAARKDPEAMIAGVPQFDSSIPLGRRIGRWLTHVWVWIETLSFDIHDSMCGFRVYPLAATAPLLDTRGLGRRMDFDPEILVRLHWEGISIISITTRVIYPVDGRSNFKLLRDNILITAMHTRLVLGMIGRLPSRLIRLLNRSRTAYG